MIDTLTYMRNFIRDKNVASITPTSPFGVKRVCGKINFDCGDLIVEYGPGTGVFTNYLLKNMKSDSTADSDRAQQEFRQILKRTIQDPRVVIFNDSAENVLETLRSCQESEADYIVSGIPFLLLNCQLKEKILYNTRRALRKGGKFLVYQTCFQADHHLKVHLERFFPRFAPDLRSGTSLRSAFTKPLNSFGHIRLRIDGISEGTRQGFARCTSEIHSLQASHQPEPKTVTSIRSDAMKSLRLLYGQPTGSAGRSSWQESWKLPLASPLDAGNHRRPEQRDGAVAFHAAGRALRSVRQLPVSLSQRLCPRGLPKRPPRSSRCVHFRPEVLDLEDHETSSRTIWTNRDSRVSSTISTVRPGVSSSCSSSRRIAETFDQYVLYRPELITRWEQGADDHWQAVLWRDLAGGLEQQHRAALGKVFLERIRKAAPGAFALPQRVSLFGISYLPPFHLQILGRPGAPDRSQRLSS